LGAAFLSPCQAFGRASHASRSASIHFSNTFSAKKVDPMKPSLPTLATLTAALAACATAAAPTSRTWMTASAPASFDGNVAGQATDQVFVLVADANPATPGVSLAAAETLRIERPLASS